MLQTLLIVFAFCSLTFGGKNKNDLKQQVEKEGGKSLSPKEAMKAFRMNIVSNFYTGPPHCFNDWIKLPGYDSCYGFIEEMVTWENARDYCRDHGGALATLNSSKELIDLSIPVFIFTQNVTGNYHLGYLKRNDGQIEDVEFLKNKQWWNATENDQSNSDNCVKTKKAKNSNLTNPLVLTCGQDEYDQDHKAYFICKMPESSCLCTKNNEPVLRNFNGKRIGLVDQTEYIIYTYRSFVITMLVWQNEISVINSSRYHPDDIDLPVSMIRLIVSNRTEYSLTNQNGIIKLFVNSTEKANSELHFTFTDSNVGFIFNNETKSAILNTIDKTVEIVYNGRHMVLSAKKETTKAGLCGNCTKRKTSTELWTYNNQIVGTPSELAELWIHPRVLWPWQTPVVDTCISSTLRQASATVCRPLFDPTLFFGSCLFNKTKTRNQMEKIYFRQCLSRGCEGGPLAACQFFEHLAQLCKFNDSYKDAFNCRKTKPCPNNYIYNSNGFCYLIAKSSDRISNSFSDYFPPINDTGFSWHSALETCHRKGAQLASITNVADHLFVHYFIRSKLQDHEDLWIGAVVDPERQAAFWSDGSPMSFEAWVVIYPVDVGFSLSVLQWRNLAPASLPLLYYLQLCSLDTDARSWVEHQDQRCAIFNSNSTWSLTQCSGNKSELANPVSALCQIRSYGEIICSGFPCIPPKECLNGSCLLPLVKVKYCVPNPCMNGGTCQTKEYAGSGYFCRCPENIFGSRCERTRDAPSISMIPPIDCSLVNTNPIKASRPCPSPEWFRVDESNCYMILKEKVDWESARENCREYGGYLAVLNSDEEIKQIAQAASDLANEFYHVGYLVDGTQKYFESSPLTEIDLGKFIDSYLSGAVTPGCAVANPAQSSFQFRTCSNLKSKDAGYICERDTTKCRCGKWNEPVVRTFNGNRVPVDNNVEYLLYMVPEKFSVSIFLKEPNSGFLSLSRYTPDVVPGVSMIIIEMYKQNTTCYMKRETTGKVSALCNDDSTALTFTNSPNDNPASIIASGLDGAMSIYFDGRNVELSVAYRIAQRSKPGTGLCGMCDDRQRAELYSPGQIKIDDKRQFSDSWIVGRDLWPSTRTPVLSCVSYSMLDASVQRCSPFYDLSHVITGACLRSRSVAEQPLAEMYDLCLYDVCQYGPNGACQYFEQLIALCGFDKIASMAKLKCGDFDWCPSQTVSHLNRCYTQSTEQFNWQNAQKHCHSSAQMLAVISDDLEFNYFAKTFTGKSWIGANIEPDSFIVSWEDRSEGDIEKMWKKQIHNNISCVSFHGDKCDNSENCLDNLKHSVCSSFVGDICNQQRCFPGQICSNDCEITPCNNNGICNNGTQCDCPQNIVGIKCDEIHPGIATTVTMPPEITETPIEAATAVEDFDVTTTAVMPPTVSAE